MTTLLLAIWAIGLIFMVAAVTFASRPGELENADPVLVAIAYMFWPVSLLAIFIHATMDGSGRGLSQVTDTQSSNLTVGYQAKQS